MYTTYRHFLWSKDSCAFFGISQFWQNTDYLHVSVLLSIPFLDQIFAMIYVFHIVPKTHLTGS